MTKEKWIWFEDERGMGAYYEAGTVEELIELVAAYKRHAR